MLKAKITEVFRSIQGEGKFAGVPQVFVRFFECNIHCVWCDTPASIGDTTRHYEEMGLDEMIVTVLSMSDGIHSVSLTGGEPLLQSEFIKPLLTQLKSNGLKSYLETNGIYADKLKEIIHDIDFIAMDIKLPSSTKCRPFWIEHEAFLKEARRKDTFIKAVISDETTYEDVIKAAQLVSGLDPKLTFILQPNSFEIQNGLIEKCQEYQKGCLKYLQDTRIMPQMQRMLKVR